MKFTKDNIQEAKQFLKELQERDLLAKAMFEDGTFREALASGNEDFLLDLANLWYKETTKNVN